MEVCVVRSLQLRAPDRKANSDTESIDVTPVVELTNVYGPQLEGAADGVKLGAELLELGEDELKSDSSDSESTMETNNSNEETTESTGKQVTSTTFLNSGTTVTKKFDNTEEAQNDSTNTVNNEDLKRKGHVVDSVIIDY